MIFATSTIFGHGCSTFGYLALVPRTWCWRTCYESGKTWRTLGSWAETTWSFVTGYSFHHPFFSTWFSLWNKVIRWGDLVNSWWKNLRGYSWGDTFLISQCPKSTVLPKPGNHGVILGESSPAMAEEFRLVKYYVVYPDSWKKIRTVSPSLGE